jgi:hypothetical protein
VGSGPARASDTITVTVAVAEPCSDSCCFRHAQYSLNSHLPHSCTSGHDRTHKQLRNFRHCALRSRGVPLLAMHGMRQDCACSDSLIWFIAEHLHQKIHRCLPIFRQLCTVTARKRLHIEILAPREGTSASLSTFLSCPDLHREQPDAHPPTCYLA